MTGIGSSRTASQRGRSRAHSPTAVRWDQPDALLFDAAAVIALFLVPFVVGGRHPAGYAALSIAAIVACLAWLLRMLRVEEPRWTVGPGEAVLAAALLIGGVQMLALPANVIDVASPRLHDLLPAYSGGPWSLGTWQTLSLTPGETSMGLSILLAQGILALVVYQFARSVEAIERLLAIVVAAAAIIALHGLIQFVGHAGKNFDVSTVSFHAEGGLVKAMFRNRNDFAGFLAIAAGPAVWLAFRQRETAKRRGPTWPRGRHARGRPELAGEADGMRIAIGLGILAIISFAVFASLARGGSIALGIATALGCGMLMRSGHLKPKMGLAILAAAAVVAIALEIHGMEQFAGRMETILDESEQEKQFGRREVWEAAWQTIIAYPLTGTGIGSHGDMSRIMMPPTGFKHFVHAENSYLNLAVETGLPGLCLAVAALGAAVAAAVMVFLRGSGPEKPIAAAITAGLVAGAVNAIGHFSWYSPAITTLLIVLGTCAVRMAARHVEWVLTLKIPVPRSMAAVLATAAVILLGTVASRQITAAIAEPKWDEAVRQSRTLARDRIKSLSSDAAATIEAGKFVQQAAAQAESLADLESLTVDGAMLEKRDGVVEQRQATLKSLDERLRLLEDVVAARPDHPRAWAELATVYCDRFCLGRLMADEPILLPELRELARASWTKGKSHDAFLTWLKGNTDDTFRDLVRAYEAAKRAVMHSPCYGDAWAVLAVLAPLESLDPELPRRCIEQALVVRPHDAKVLYEAAEQARLDGDADLASLRLRECFAKSAERRTGVLATLLPFYSADEAVALLEPDLAGLRAIDVAWSRQSSPDAMRPVRERRLVAVLAAADEASSPQQAGQRCGLLCEAASLHRALGRNEQAAAALTAALTANPSHYDARMARVDLAMALDDPDTAKQHLDWLLLRRPDAKAVQARVSKLQQLRVRLASAPALMTTSPDTSPTPSGARQ